MTTEARQPRRERRQQRREDERRRQRDQTQRARLSRYGLYAAIAILVVVGIGLAAGPLGSAFNSGLAAQGTQYAEQGKEHIEVGTTHAAYNSNPPTSGPHYPAPANWGVYDQPLPDEQLVHNLEHGGIVIEYNCPDGCPDLVQQLKDVVRQSGPKLVLAPRPNKDEPYRITIAAWTWLDGFNDFDAARITAFIKAHRNSVTAPEPSVD
jgi:hypothetical protein